MPPQALLAMAVAMAAGPHSCSPDRPSTGGEPEWREGPGAARYAKAPIVGQVTVRR